MSRSPDRCRASTPSGHRGWETRLADEEPCRTTHTVAREVQERRGTPRRVPRPFTHRPFLESERVRERHLEGTASGRLSKKLGAQDDCIQIVTNRQRGVGVVGHQFELGGTLGSGLIGTRPQAEVDSVLNVTFDAFTTERAFRFGQNDRADDLMAGNLRSQERFPGRKF